MRWLGKAGLSDLVALWWVAGHTDWTFQGGGAEGREREQSTINCWTKIVVIETLLYIYTHHIIIRLNSWKVVPVYIFYKLFLS